MYFPPDIVLQMVIRLPKGEAPVSHFAGIQWIK